MREATTRAESNLGDETYPPHTGRSHVTASATAKYANDTCAATRAAPSVDMVSARSSEGSTPSVWRFASSLVVFFFSRGSGWKKCTEAEVDLGV